MDPQATLNNAEIAFVTDLEECAELLAAYFEWRLKGGFQPKDGDEKALDLLRRIGELGQEQADELVDKILEEED